MVKLSNGLELQELCYGSAIVSDYRHDSLEELSRAKHNISNYFRNKGQYRKDHELPKMIAAAYENGLRMYDTSRAYGGSEYSIGKALKGKNRSSYILVTKLCNADQYTGNIESALKTSLKELNTDYVDLYLMHWPVAGHFIDSWKQMEHLYKKGLCKAIGVCNCNIHHLEEIKKSAEILPMVNQFECHPLFTQTKLRSYCKDNGIQVMAYTSTARNDERLRKTVLAPIAKKYKKTISQVILRWHQQIGNIPIVNTSSKNHLLEDIHIKDFSLSNEEINAIEKININSRLRYDPDNCDFRQL